MEIKITAKNQDFHVVLVKMCDFNKRQSIKKTLGRGLFLLFFLTIAKLSDTWSLIVMSQASFEESRCHFV
jgi:hypothetical protein